jgi:hypothetical protein
MGNALAARLARPVDLASTAAFRILFGLLMCGGALRFIAAGWVDVQYVRPDYFFKYSGFEWVGVPGPAGLYALYGVQAVAALGIALGLFYRASVITFALAFTYAELMDVTNYLNHYYLAALLALLMALAPLGSMWSLDALRRPDRARTHAPTWMLSLLRFQVAVVYGFAALAKAHPDWLVHGQPLGIWLAARTDTPVIGLLFAQPWAPLAMSWAGFLYDATIVGWLLWRRSRPWAYLVVCGFHGMTAVLFDIGMFPFLMTVATTLFFEPDWPRRLLRQPRPPEAGARPAVRAPALAAMAAFCLVQALFPLRAHVLYPDRLDGVLWHEQGMRWAWKVMVREKNGSVVYRATDTSMGRTWEVPAERYLQPRQAAEMAGQPDLIADLAWRVAEELRAQGVGPLEVRVDAWASLNGRAPARLIDPEVDLLTADRTWWRPAPWITARPEGPPLRPEWAAR